MFRTLGALLTVLRVFALGCVLLAGCSSAPQQQSAVPPEKAGDFAIIPPNKDNDLKLYYPDGRMLRGREALARMHQDAGLILWLAGNQFFAMDDVVRAFQAQNRSMNVGLITLPPGLILSAIERGGWIYEGKSYPGRPDVYSSVNLGHLKTLKVAGMMSQYAIHMHNEMVVMVAKGNPRKIRGIADLKRADVRTSMPNPVNEGIMQFYGRKVLEQHNLWDHIAGGQECSSCQTTANNWFTAVHHRETPDRILANQSDTGIVWLTEAIEAQRDGKAIEAVRLPPGDSLVNEVAYAIGPLDASRRRSVALRYLAFLSTPEAQAAYSKYGFVVATPESLTLKPIP